MVSITDLISCILNGTPFMKQILIALQNFTLKIIIIQSVFLCAKQPN